MKGVWIVCWLLLAAFGAEPLPLQHPMRFADTQSPEGWVMSEKLDGVRGVWNGTQLLSRHGRPIHAPEWFTRNFPPFALDGELWSRRGAFEAIQSTVLSSRPDARWHSITYNIFEVPQAPGDFMRRLERARRWFAAHPNPHIRFIPQHPIKNRAALQTFFRHVRRLGGEGVILKDPKRPYFSGRSPYILKLKSAPDMEGEVVAIHPGKGKFAGMMGSLTLRLKNGVRFRLGSGFRLKERLHPPAIGSLVTFRYHGFTKNRIPKFASFLRVRQRE